jgi:hypothetical protein
VRHLKVDLIQRIAANLDASKLSGASTGEGTWIKPQVLGARVGMKRLEFAMASLPALPVEEPERTAEAARRALPELVGSRATKLSLLPGETAPSALSRKASENDRMKLKLRN